MFEWTRRQIQLGKRGAIPNHPGGILKRIGLDCSNWRELVRRFGKVVKRGAGAGESLAPAATHRGRQSLQSTGASLLATAPDSGNVTGWPQGGRL